MWEAAQGFQRYRQFADAVAAYNEFIGAFPREDRLDDAIFQIGVCFKETNILCNQVNDAEGPDQIFRLRESWALATRGGDVSRARGSQAAGDASQAFMDVAFRCPGTDQAAEALYQLSKVFEDMKAFDLQAEVFQRIVIDYPTSDPDHATEALAGLLKWYVEKATWPDAVPLYQALARAYPTIFPPELAEHTDLLVSMLKLYETETAHGWYERHLGHVRNRSFGPGDLIDDSNYVLGSLLVSAGETKQGLARLRAVMNTPTSDFAALALYNIAKAYELQDNYKDATEIYQTILAKYGNSGLADDAQDSLAMIDGKKDVAPGKEALAQAEKALGRSLAGYDFYIGKNVVVFCPYMAAAKTRAYNMPQIWDQAQESLAKWTGLPEHLAKRQVMVLTEEPSGAAGEVIRLPAREVTDPPNWALGLRELTQNYLSDPALGIVGGMSPAVAEALTSLGTAHLQYALVSETRDTIGSASAVKLPFENLIREREAARASLEKYIQDGAGGLGKLSPQTATGMMLALLDQYGYGESGIIDCSPLKGFFSMIEEAAPNVDPHNRQACTFTVLRALNQAFNADVSPFFRQWGILEG
jgi:TolA-binding protein